MPRLAVLGHPVAHSRSPAMQNAALAALGLGRSGATRRSTSPRRSSRRGCGRWPAEGFAGANVTVPHKLAALALADVASESRAGDRRRQHADLRRRAGSAPTTPTPAACSPRCPSRRAGRRALVLGAGGAARAAIWALGAEGPSVEVWNRTAASAAEAPSAPSCGRRARGRPSPRAGRAYELIVNTTAVGLGGEDPFEDLPLRRDGFAPGQMVVDMVYGERLSRCWPPPRRPGRQPSTASRSWSSRAPSRSRSGPAASRRSTSCAPPPAVARRIASRL